MLKPVPLTDPPPAGWTPFTLVLTLEMLKYMRPEMVVESHHLPLLKLASSVFTAAGTALDAAWLASDAAVCAAAAAVCACAACVAALVAALWAVFTFATVSRCAAS